MNQGKKKSYCCTKFQSIVIASSKFDAHTNYVSNDMRYNSFR